MAIKIRKLIPDLAEDYVHFFDITRHDDNVDEHKCYCVCWCNSGDAVVGWCNAKTKSDCLKCASWRRFMAYVPLEESNTGLKVKSIFCFVIAPEMKRQGVATLLLERVCKDAAQDGFDFVEAYPYKESSYQSSDFGGYYEMYKKVGFFVSLETEQGLIMRKQLK